MGNILRPIQKAHNIVVFSLARNYCKVRLRIQLGASCVCSSPIHSLLNNLIATVSIGQVREV